MDMHLPFYFLMTKLRLHMKLTRPVFFIAINIFAMLPAFAGQSPGDNRHPNVLLILADDMGFADLNINNPAANSPTPNLNALAESGIRFTRHYTESTCSPSRAALITGSYPSRIHFNPNGFGIPIELETLPRAFKAAGYSTHQIGKWHLGHLVREAWPDAQGFDTWLGFLNQWLMINPDRKGGFHYGKTTHLNAYLQNEHGEIKQYPGHLTDVVTDETIRLIRNKKNSPWFIYAAYFAPHEPMEPRADYAARFPDTPAGRYAALVSHLDDRISDILKALDETGQRRNTIVVFASDNGGTNKRLNNNAPFIGKKAEYLEGGVRTPLLISWPGKISRHRTTNNVVSIMDIYPSIATLAGIRFQKNLDGRSLFNNHGDLINLPPRPLFWDTASDSLTTYSVLSSDGRWRLYQGWFGAPSLFDLNKDPISAVNVASEHPDIVTRLRTDYENWETLIARLQLQMTQRDQTGHGILIGDRIQRAATFGDITIAIGLTPKQAVSEEQVIIEQKSMSRITQDSGGLHIRFHGLNADLPSLANNQCSSLVMTGTFNRKIELSNFGRSILNIYLNGALLKSVKQDVPLLDSTDIQHATYIGMSEDGSHRFDGKLSVPIYLNRRADTNAPPALKVDALSRQVCFSNKN
jgi:arylsulfatase A-like enzyme